MSNYSKKLSYSLNIKLNDMLEQMPDFIKMFFTGIDASTAIKTRIAYAIDLNTFLSYLINESLL
ncbi:MAG: integrase, partial [Eubacteriaceae bacterium]|nr:integrase [Eubacteriaceae bacterium]